MDITETENVQNTLCITCTWDKDSDCLNCEIKGQLDCKWDVKLLQRFYKIALPAILIGGLGFIIVGLNVSWLPLLVYIIFWVFFFVFFEIRVLCSHCPYYAEEGRILHCLANHGTPKLWRYHPEPLNVFEKLGFLAGAAFFILFPVATELYGIYVLWNQFNTLSITIAVLAGLAVLSFVTGINFIVAIRRHACPNCVNFSCPLNLVPKEIVDAYLERNPVMKEAWEARGYQLG
ncbi:MAG: hypothetical protein ACFFC7_24870 [Candidatus Hermodarchaeota archaeon]